MRNGNASRHLKVSTVLFPISDWHTKSTSRRQARIPIKQPKASRSLWTESLTVGYVMSSYQVRLCQVMLSSYVKLSYVKVIGEQIRTFERPALGNDVVLPALAGYPHETSNGGLCSHHAIPLGQLKKNRPFGVDTSRGTGCGRSVRNCCP